MISALLVEDDKNLADSLIHYLSSESIDVRHATNISGAKLLLKKEPQILILDWMLPDGHGIDYLKELRKEGNAIPIILLTSRNDLIDKVLGLESGANDYITKPFEPRELVARIRAQLRGSSIKAQTPELRCSGIILNPTTHEASFNDTFLDLTKMEFELLKTLMESPNRVFPREALLNKVWGYENYPTTRTVDNHIVQLRQKISSDLFETVRGVGYRLREVKK